MALSSEPPSARPALPQHLDFLQEAERPRRRDSSTKLSSEIRIVRD
jgi:hypothetical protein